MIYYDYLGVAVLVVLICLGVFVCIAAGVVYAQKLVRYHAKILHKYTLTKDIMVEDLDKGTESEILTTDLESNDNDKRINVINNKLEVLSSFSWNSNRKDYQALQQSCNDNNNNNNSNNIIISENINRSLTSNQEETSPTTTIMNNNNNEFEMRNITLSNTYNRIDRRKL